ALGSAIRARHRGRPCQMMPLECASAFTLACCTVLLDRGRRDGVSVLVLLCHKFRYLFRAAQHGQRDSIVARAATNLRRIVAIEFGTWRSGRNGGSSGLVTFA